MPLIAITRQVSPSINDCELTFHAREPIDLNKAISQHKAYQDCLADLGVQVVSLLAEPCLPDAVFVEDTAVVADEVAIIANMGAKSRRLETRSVAEALASYRPLKFFAEPGTLDGGDVLRVGRTFFVGLSQRTNRQGIEQLRELLWPYDYEVEPIAVRGCLHMKSACSHLGNNTVLVNQSWIDPSPLGHFELVDVPPEEPLAANALWLSDVAIMPSSHPKTRALLEERGLRVRTIDLSEIQKAEAGVTCCSLIFAS